jgi:hypothetical protein
MYNQLIKQTACIDIKESLKFNQHKHFLQTEILNRLLNSCNASVCVCENFLNKVRSSLIRLETIEFSKQKRKLVKINQKSNLILLESRRPYLIHFS